MTKETQAQTRIIGGIARPPTGHSPETDSIFEAALKRAKQIKRANSKSQHKQQH